MLNPDGIFSTKSAWEIIRRRGSICPWNKWLWHKHVPKKMSFVCWRARKEALPVDDLIQKLGVSIASKCNCCSCPQAENIDHVLCDGEVARRVWEYFAAIFGYRLP
ncbi:hypothetical protein QYF36_011330 [Acer negundo]|nr:hypothetical protein QYF36_011330 [Acer negundo]